ncbi:MAG: TRAP transporter small permease, partial [Lentibacter algarum]|nr:TRAP transporter small permease [Lentibacter algarum]
RFLEPLMNEGEEYEKLPRFIPYVILPFGMALMLFRFIQATVRVWTGEATSLIVSHEAEDAVEDARRAHGQGD